MNITVTHEMNTNVSAEIPTELDDNEDEIISKLGFSKILLFNVRSFY